MDIAAKPVSTAVQNSLTGPAGGRLLCGSSSVHYHDEAGRGPCFLEAVRSEAVPPGYAIDDGVGCCSPATIWSRR